MLGACVNVLCDNKLIIVAFVNKLFICLIIGCISLLLKHNFNL